MAQKRIIKIGGFTGNVVANGQQTINVPTTDAYSKFFIQFWNVAAEALVADIKSSVGKITILINGNTHKELPATEFLEMQDLFYGALGGVNQPGVVPIYEARPDLNFADYLANQILDSEETFVLGTVGLNSVQIIINYLGTITGITRAELSVEALPNRKPGVIIDTKSLNSTASGTGDLDTTNLPKGDYLGIHAKWTAGTIINGAVRLGSDDVKTDVANAVNQTNLKNAGRKPQTNYFHFDYTADGKIGSKLSANSDLLVRLNASVSVSGLKFIYETINASYAN